MLPRKLKLSMATKQTLNRKWTAMFLLMAEQKSDDEDDEGKNYEDEDMLSLMTKARKILLGKLRQQLHDGSLMTLQAGLEVSQEMKCESPLWRLLACTDASAEWNDVLCQPAAGPRHNRSGPPNIVANDRHFWPWLIVATWRRQPSIPYGSLPVFRKVALLGPSMSHCSPSVISSSWHCTLWEKHVPYWKCRLQWLRCPSQHDRQQG